MECHTCQRLALMLHPVCEGGHVHSVAGSLHCETPGIELAEAASLVQMQASSSDESEPVTLSHVFNTHPNHLEAGENVIGDILRQWCVVHEDFVTLHKVPHPPSDLVVHNAGATRVYILELVTDSHYRSFPDDKMTLTDVRLEGVGGGSGEGITNRRVQFARSLMTRASVLAMVRQLDMCQKMHEPPCDVLHNQKVWPETDVPQRVIKDGDTFSITLFTTEEHPPASKAINADLVGGMCKTHLMADQLGAPQDLAAEMSR